MALLEPEPGGAGIAVEFCGPGVEFRLAVIEILLPDAEVLGKLRRLGFNRAADGFGWRRLRLVSFQGREWAQGGPAIQRFQIDAAVAIG